MKKRILIFTLMSSLFLGSQVYAATSDVNDGNMYIQTEHVTDDFSEYANRNFLNLLQAKMLQDGLDMADATSYSLGSPFSILNKETDIQSFYYPVLKDNKVQYTYVLSKDNETFIGQLSEFLANELQGLLDNNVTSKENPITFFSTSGDIFYNLDNQDILLYSAPIENKVTEEEIKKNDFNNLDLEVINIEEEQEFDISNDLSVSNPFSRKVNTGYNYSLIDFTISETQKQENWCAAYSAAAILNNKNDKRPTNASTIMKWKYGNLPYDTLKNKAISQSDLVKYANTKKVYPKLVNSRLTLGEVKNQINKGNAIYAGAQGTGGYLGNRHALVILGWIKPIDREDMYYVWNPWWTYTSVIEVKNNTLPVPGGSWVWDNTITNW